MSHTAHVQRLPMAKAINLGLRRALEQDPSVLLMGEDIGSLGGVFRVTDGLEKDFGATRVVDTPLAESGIVGTAIGLAMAGYRPVCEIQFDGDRKSTRLNSSHVAISYAVFCLKKKRKVRMTTYVVVTMYA